jgi:hypothetical protein
MAAFNDEKKVDAMETGRRESIGANRRGSAPNAFLAQRLSSAGVEDIDAQEGQLYSMGETDPALDAKMRLLNSVSPTRNAQSNEPCLTRGRPSMRSDGQACTRDYSS